jgi:transcriptional regulator with XRE-family HTH domain
MATRQRSVDEATVRGRRDLAEFGRQIRIARLDHGLSTTDVARGLGWSHSKVSRIERDMYPDLGIVESHRLAAVVGLEASSRLFPGGDAMRDAGHAQLLERLRARIHPTLRWSVEVPLPIPGDRRAWDALIGGNGWRAGVEAETGLRDAQALSRRLQLKRRDGAVDGIILLVPATKRTREFLKVAGPALKTHLPMDGRTILERLATGADPAASGIVML